MAADSSKAQIDKLGDRLRDGPLTEADLRLLDEYRQSFSESYEAVVCTIRDNLGLEPTGRKDKTPGSIIAKLRREKTIRLSRMQDIAGCRVVVSDIVEQERVVESLRSAFPKAKVVDRRAKPSHGYRAVHVIPRIEGKPIEIQIRTLLQDLWANLSETFADVFNDPTIKYGGGEDEGIEGYLWETSKSIELAEEVESYRILELLLESRFMVGFMGSDGLRSKLETSKDDLVKMGYSEVQAEQEAVRCFVRNIVKPGLEREVSNTISSLEKQKRRKQCSS